MLDFPIFAIISLQKAKIAFESIEFSKCLRNLIFNRGLRSEKHFQSCSDSHSFIFPVRFRMCKKGPQKSRFKKEISVSDRQTTKAPDQKQKLGYVKRPKKEPKSSQWRLRRPKAFERRQRNPRQTFLSAFTKMTVTKWHIQKFGQQSLEKKLR